MSLVRNNKGMTLIFALMLTFIFSALVSVAFLFVTINTKQMQGSLRVQQCIAVAEGINERIKARLNTKTLIMLSEDEEGKLAYDDDFEEEDDDDLFDEEDFDEDTELFSEYYADEVVKISRFITFRNPPELIETEEESAEGFEDEPEDSAQQAQANVKTIGSIDIPQGTVLQKGLMIVIHKDEKIDLMLKDIGLEQGYVPFRDKLPVPKIKTLSPNYAEANSRADFVVIGENLTYDENARFSNKDIVVEDIKSGPLIEFLIKEDVMPGVVNFYWDKASAEFYIIPPYEGESSPIIDEIQTEIGDQFLDVKAGQRGITLMVLGYDLFLNMNLPVLVPDVNGITTKIKDQSVAGNQLTVSLKIDKNVEPGVHSLFLATEGGFSNSWTFNVLPPDQNKDISSFNTVTYTTSLTLLNVNVIENLLPLIDEDEYDDDFEEGAATLDPGDPLYDEDDVPEKARLSTFANTDLETTWLLETSAMVGNITRTASEVVQRRVPNINAAIITNGRVEFNGGSFRILGSTTAMTKLVDATYLSNTQLKVEGPPDPEDEGFGYRDEPEDGEEPIQSPLEAGFVEGSFVTAYMAGREIEMLDYGIISSLGNNTINLIPPGLMDFHYEDDEVFQFVPPVISNEPIQDDIAERHLVPKDFAITIPGAANFRNLFGSNLDQLSILADLYTNDSEIPQDEYDLPVGFMNLTYIDGTPVFSEDNNLIGKGIIIIDTRGDNLGRADGTVEITGDSRSPAEFTGIVYIKGNLRIGGNISINGALIVDNTEYGQIEIASNALGMITYDERAIKQTILSTPFTTKPGSVMISSKPIDLGNYVLSGKEEVQLGASSNVGGEEALLTDDTEGLMPKAGLEEELIKFFE